VLLLAAPAQAAPSGHPDKPRASHQHGIPIDLHLGDLGLPVPVPLDLGILNGLGSPESPPSTGAAAPSTAPEPSHRPSPPSKTQQKPPTSRSTRTHPPAPAGRAAVPFVAATHRARHTHPTHRPRHITKHHPKVSPARHHDVAAGLFSSQPLEGTNVAALLAVISVFGIGVLGIVLAGGRRRQPGAKHRG
jgi:hypothetical protein